MAGAAPHIAEARTRAATAKRLIAAVSVTGFLTAFVLARAAHPGHTAAPQPTIPSPSTGLSSEEDGGGFGFGSGSIAPPQNVLPSVQTSTS